MMTGDLNMHQQIRTGIKEYECGQFGKVSITLGRLLNIERFALVRRNVCEECGKALRVNSGLFIKHLG